MLFFEYYDTWNYKLTSFFSIEISQANVVTATRFEAMLFSPRATHGTMELAERKQNLLLLQIDTDNEIEWGDSGVANVFISPEALRARQFDQAWFTWDYC